MNLISGIDRSLSFFIAYFDYEIPSDTEANKNEYIISITDILRLSKLSAKYGLNGKYELLFRKSIMKRVESSKIIFKLSMKSIV